ncbi:zinc-finger homeodomain protein 1-like [Andrographis paniculata]|uniref:zinc-finger homeodomain protein 1-like n=1 Tax=Andrographis paniculata TaxID=175694 RepID=UPI0021E99978|nr:zinc-finger homeodomain protein 1-like [Andrographis paniculata]
MEGDHSIYRECLRNHAASLGSYATDGCGEFTLDDTIPNLNLNCAACGCHRNFHRKVVTHHIYPQLHHDFTATATPPAAETTTTTMMMDYRESSRSRSSKRFRSKFTEEQKEQMLGFAEKLGWRLQRKDPAADGDDDEIERFCRGIGISRKVFKVWMHNHKNSSSPSPSPSHSAAASTGNNASSLTDHR